MLFTKNKFKKLWEKKQHSAFTIIEIVDSKFVYFSNTQ